VDRGRVVNDAALREGVLAANDAFYAAVEAGDLDGLREICCSSRELVCVHPGASPIHGTSGVLRSWALIMANTEYIQFFLTDVTVTLSDDVAAVTCTENILTAGEPRTTTFNGGKAQAVNVFTLEEGRWRLWLHQASPVGSETI
jgi:ketosteroid isomerase-like protein